MGCLIYSRRWLLWFLFFFRLLFLLFHLSRLSLRLYLLSLLLFFIYLFSFKGVLLKFFLQRLWFLWLLCLLIYFNFFNRCLLLNLLFLRFRYLHHMLRLSDDNMTVNSITLTFMLNFNSFTIGMNDLAFPTVQGFGKLQSPLSLILHKGIYLSMQLSLSKRVLELTLFLEFCSSFFGFFYGSFLVLGLGGLDLFDINFIGFS